MAVAAAVHGAAVVAVVAAVAVAAAQQRLGAEVPKAPTSAQYACSLAPPAHPGAVVGPHYPLGVAVATAMVAAH